MTDETRFLSIPEAAARLGVSRIAVFKRVKKGRLAAIRIGRNWAIPVSALEAAPQKTPLSAPKISATAPAKAIKPRPPAPTEKKPVKAETDTLEDMGWD